MKNELDVACTCGPRRDGLMEPTPRGRKLLSFILCLRPGRCVAASAFPRTVQLTPQPARALRDSALAQTATRQRSYKPAPTSRRCDRCSGTRSEGSSPPGQEDSREGASLRCQRQQLPGVSLDGVSHKDHKPFQHACPWPLSSHSDALPKGNKAQRTALPSLLAPTYGTSQGPSHLATPPTILDSASRTAALRWNSGMPPGSPLLTGCPVFKATSRMITKPTL